MSKYLKSITGKIFLILVLLFCSSFLFAGPLKIAYVDSEKIMSQYEEANKIRLSLENEFKSWDDELKEMESEIAELEAKYEQQQSTMLESAKTEAEKKIMMKYEKRKIFYEEIMGENGKLARRQVELMQPILEKIQNVIQEIREKESISIIFEVLNSGIIDADPELDISDKIIEALNNLK